MNTGNPRWILGVTAAVYLFLHLPILVLVVFSFNDSKFSVDWQGFTLQWYSRLLERPDIIRGCGSVSSWASSPPSSRRRSAP